MDKAALIEAKKLKKYYYQSKSVWNPFPRVGVKAVDGVSLRIRRGESLGLVGESGCGKSSLGRTLIALTKATEGEVLYQGENILNYSGSRLRGLRKKLQIIFQNPYSYLNPKMRIGDILSEPLEIAGEAKELCREKTLRMIKDIGLEESYTKRFPHEFSGGQLQRILIGRALISDPDFMVCDEAVSSLDVSVRAQILNLLQQTRQERKLSYLFITHDLASVRYISDRIAVMYLGKIVETASTGDLFSEALHPYTRLLISSVLSIHSEGRGEWNALQSGEEVQNQNFGGCVFYARCPYRRKQCAKEEPKLKRLDSSRELACFLYE